MEENTKMLVVHSLGSTYILEEGESEDSEDPTNLLGEGK